MGNSTSRYTLSYGKPMDWESSKPLPPLWFDKLDDMIETYCAPQNTYQGHPIFKLQKRLLSSSARIVVRNYVLSKQVTIMKAESVKDARLGYQYLVNMVLDAPDLLNPETVKSALERLQKLPATRFQNLINVHGNLFPEPLLRPLDPMWNPGDFHADIILVHGLGGDSETTWRNDNGLWPIVWLLDAQSGIRSMVGRYNIHNLPPTNKIRVLTVAHQSNMRNITHDTDPRLIAQRLVELLSHAGVGSKPIVWIAHSLGGLIVKEVLYSSQRGLRQDILRSTKGVVFFGTPHCGATWASTLRQVTTMHNSSGLIYLDPSPNAGVLAGNGDRLRELNEFFSQTTIPFLNFSEGLPCSPSFLASLINIIVVPDAQAHIIGSVTVDPVQQAERMSEGIVPQRVHYPCRDYHHMNIAKPSNRNDATFRLTKIYVAHWLQYPTTATNNTEHVSSDDFTRGIVDSVRMYSLVIERITDENRVRVLTDVSTALGSVLRTMTITEFLILIAFLSSAFVAAGASSVVAGAAIGGPIGVAVAGIGLAAAAGLGAALAARLAPRVRALLTSNSAVIREMVNLISAYVMPDFQDIMSSARSEQELEATLNHLRRAVVQTICCVFLEPAEPRVTLRNTDAICVAVNAHSHQVRQAEIVIDHLSRVMNGVTSINSDETEQTARAILTPAFINQALQGTATDLY